MNTHQLYRHLVQKATMLLPTGGDVYDDAPPTHSTTKNPTARDALWGKNWGCRGMG
ncbi:hypothetical protein IQ246_16205 [aff. Roholtiella sp. LEGE 12411]|nr:hypothetical protein [aff. Roholtiella sp. LEGE 12411]